MFITNQRTDFKDFLHTCFKNSNDGIELYLIEIFCFDFEWQDHEPQYFESLRHGSVAISSHVNLRLVLTKKTSRETLVSILTNFVNDNYKFLSNLQLLCHRFRTRNAKTTFWVIVGSYLDLPWPPRAEEGLRVDSDTLRYLKKIKPLCPSRKCGPNVEEAKIQNGRRRPSWIY